MDVGDVVKEGTETEARVNVRHRGLRGVYKSGPVALGGRNKRGLFPSGGHIAVNS